MSLPTPSPLDRPLALPAYIWHGWKGFHETNTLAYWATSTVTNFQAWSNKPTQVKDLRTFISLPSSSLGQAPSFASVRLTWLERLSWGKHSSWLSLFDSDEEKMFSNIDNCWSMSQLSMTKLERFSCQAFQPGLISLLEWRTSGHYVATNPLSLGQAPSLASIHLTRLGRFSMDKHSSLSSLFDSDSEKKFYDIDNCILMSQLLKNKL